MNKLSLHNTGGYPFIQDRVKDLQDSIIECFAQLCQQAGVENSAIILSGMELSIVGSYATISDGYYFLWSDSGAVREIVKFTDAGPVAIGGATVAGVYFEGITVNKAYYNLAVQDVTADFMSGIAAVPDWPIGTDPFFSYNYMKSFHQAFGELGRESAFADLTVATIASDGGVSGDIFYKKNFINNTLHIYGSLSSANAQNFAGSAAPTFYLMGTLPDGYMPVSSSAVFFARTTTTNLDDASVQYIRQLNAIIDTSGNVYIEWIKPHVGVASYNITFSAIIPLD